MNIDVTKPVREVALNVPGATRVLEDFGIDYCCGGNKPFAQACAERHLELQRVIESLESAAMTEGKRKKSRAQPQGDWRSVPISDLIAHIKERHHNYVKSEISRLGPRFDKVLKAHGSRHPELLELRREFRDLAEDLATHMMKEEMVLFPYIERMEEAVIGGQPILPAPFGGVDHPVAAMVDEHDLARNRLRKMRALTNAYQPPEGACMSYRDLYRALAEFERDLHHHVHLENNILFPRAIKMEREKRC